MFRKSWKKLSTALVISSLLIAVAGCGHDGTPAEKDKASKGYPVSWVETIDGKEIKGEVKEAPKKAVSMSQATTEMMLTLGLEKQMAGTAFKEEEIYPPLQKAYESVKVISQKWPSLEVFMAEKPDFATGWGVAFTKRGIPADQLTSKNIPIWVPQSMLKDDATLDTLFEDMMKLGAIFNATDKAKTWVEGQKKDLKAIEGKVGSLPKVKVFVFDSEDGKPFTVFNGYTTNILKLIGAENVMANPSVKKTWGTANWEDVVAANPDYIIIADYGTSIRNDDDFNKKVASLKSNPILANVKAVKENHFVKIKLSEITPGVRTVDALIRIAEQIHGVKVK